MPQARHSKLHPPPRVPEVTRISRGSVEMLSSFEDLTADLVAEVPVGPLQCPFAAEAPEELVELAAPHVP